MTIHYILSWENNNLHLRVNCCFPKTIYSIDLSIRKRHLRWIVEPWDKHWIKTELDGIGWYSIVLDVVDGIQWYAMVFNSIHRDFLGFVGICWDLMVFHGIQWNSMVYNGILL